MLIYELFAVPLMQLFGASEQTLKMAVEYFRIVAAFFPFYLLLNVMNSMIRADGSPTYAMAAMLTGAITNIILDPVFIFLLKWGDPHNYSLCIDASMGIDKCAEQICSLTQK